MAEHANAGADKRLLSEGGVGRRMFLSFSVGKPDGPWWPVVVHGNASDGLGPFIAF